MEPVENLPIGLVDPISLHELAVELGMTVSELLNGRGSPTPIEEVAVWWPLFNRYRAKVAAKQQAEMEQSRGRV